MTYLELINAVLDRLRENRAVSTDIDSNPFFRVIGAQVNDAKRFVEQAWHWKALQAEDANVTEASNEIMTLSGSADNDYIYGRFHLVDEGRDLLMASDQWMHQRYIDDATNPISEKAPSYVAPYFQDTATGNQQVRLFPRPDDIYNINVLRWKRQDDLVNQDDRLLVPSLPVYTYATALASRERGEIGGTPTSELFSIATAHLADAIAYDSTQSPEPLQWYNEQNVAQTNIRQ